MASAAAHALTSGSLSSSLTRPHATSDSRLLTNLVKCEKALSSHLDEEVKAAHTASAALAAWGTSEAPDIAATANRLSNLLNAVADVQRTHVQAIEGYRSALKDVLDREQSIRTVVRDRDILVGRLIKASKKTKGTDAERAEKVNRAQRELHSCEQVLQAEESALIGVKRRTFKEALTMRMKTMGDAGAGMVDAARDAIILLDGFDTVGGGADMGNRGIMGNSDGMGHGMDESGEWEGEEDGRHQLNDPRMSAQFESASVTPSQSASQVQYGNRLNNQGPSQRYSTNLHDIGDASGPDAPEKNGNGQEDSDSESDDDYQEAFGGENLHRHSNVPPPHLLSAGAGTDNDFLPSAPRNLAPPNGNKTSQRSGNSPAPTPPRKDSASDLRKERAAAVAAHPQVPMPAIPTAPRFNVDGTNLGSIPRAPSMLVAGADAESSSDEDTRPTTQHRGGWGGSNTPSRPPLRAGRGGDNSSDEGGTVTSKRGGGKRSNSFFGKVGKLFKTDLSKQPTSGKESPRNTPERPRSNWDTRTDANLSSVRGHDSISRRTSVLRGPINPPEPDSSDEEDNRDVIRNVNPRRPLWQGEKASSDVGVGGGIGSLSKRPSMLKRSSSNATARITPGPMSSKAAEEAARRSVIGAGFAGTPSKPIGAAGDGTGSIKKKKKKKASSNAGSEVGTSATRTRASGPPPASSSGANDRTSIIVAGDASSGIRRSGSLSTGTGKGAAGSLSRTGTAQSIRSVDGGKKKRSSLANMSPKDGEGKFTTSSWIAKSETNPSVQNMTAAQAAANAGVVPKGSAAAVPTSAAVAPSASPLKVPKAPAPVHGSASRGAPLKPALKAGSLSRSGSYSSSAGPSPAAILGPPVQAPPAASSIFTATAPPPMSASAAVPASTSLQGPPRLPELSGLEGEQQRPKAPESSLSIQEDKTFDGTGHLDVSLDGTPQKAAPVVTPTKKQSVPKLDMPTPEPFSFDLEARRGSSATGGTVSPGLMTPSQREAYERILGEGNVNEVSASPSRHLTAQPEGVTRTTDRSQKLSTSRVYSSGGGLVDDSSSESEQGLQDSAAPHGKEGSSEAARKAAEAQMSGAFSDEKSDPQLKGLSASIGTGQPASGGLHPAIKSSGPRSDTSSSAVGTGVERRKSVRMAPDTKLPPETPTGDTFDTTPRGGQSETKDPLAAAGASQSQLSSRIAPPPQAPPRLPNKEAQNQPIDLGRDRERSSWTTRIGQSNDDSSSDEDETGGGLDSYASARRAFGSASRHLGKATGEIKPKKKNEEEVASVKSGSKPKTKKKKEPANHGYNTAVPLPAGMEVVGRSPSVRKKK